MTTENRRVGIDLLSYKPSQDAKAWDLPVLGHPISQGVFPLFILFEGKFSLIGTAFSVGRGLQLVVTASHNVEELFKREPKFERALDAADRQRFSGFDIVNLYILHQTTNIPNSLKWTLWPIEKINIASPTDVTFCNPIFREDLASVTFPLSFDIPSIGERVYSVGYCYAGTRQSADVPAEAVSSGSFDWQRYGLRLRVVEGTVVRVFAREFSKGFLKSPCFLFDQDIEHAMSGGPVLGGAGTVIGVNSAGAESFMGHPSSLATLFWPIILCDVSATAKNGVIVVKITQPLLNYIENGIIATDGSEKKLRYVVDQVGGDLKPTITAGADDQLVFTHDDVHGYLENKPAVPDEIKTRLLVRSSDGVGLDSNSDVDSSSEQEDRALSHKESPDKP